MTFSIWWQMADQTGLMDDGTVVTLSDCGCVVRILRHRGDDIYIELMDGCEQHRDFPYPTALPSTTRVQEDVLDEFLKRAFPDRS